MYLGDFRPSAPVDTSFLTTSDGKTPATLGGTPVVSIYKDNSTAQSTAGVTLTPDFDGVTGYNHLRIDLSADPTFYAAGSSYRAVITTGTVSGTSAVGYVVAEFSIHARGAQRPNRIEAQRKVGVALGSAPNKKVRFQLVRAGGGGFLSSTEAASALVSGDVKVSIDNGALNPVTTLPTYNAGAFELELSNAELTGALVSVKIAGAAPKVFDDLDIEIETVGAGGMYPDDQFTASSATPPHFADLKISATTGLVEIDATSITAIIAAMDGTSTQLAALLSLAGTLQTAVVNLNNLSALANLFGPGIMEIPDSGTRVYPFTLTVRDSQGHLVDLDASPTIAAVNGLGTDRSGNLSAVTHPSTGVYVFTYTAAFGAVEEGLRVTATGAVSGSARRADISTTVADYDSLTLLNTIATKVANLPTDPASEANAATNKGLVLARLGAPAGASIAADIAAVEAHAAAVDTRLPASPADETLIITATTAISTALAAVKAKTDALPTAPADETLVIAATNALGAAIAALNNLNATQAQNAVAAALTAFGAAKTSDVPTAIQNADTLLDRDMSTGADTGTETKRTPRQALRTLRNKVTATTVCKEDDATPSFTFALTTDPSAQPVVSINPTGGA